jgi:hypothetical protein
MSEWSRDSSFGIAADTNCTTKARGQAWQDFPLLHSVQTGCGAHAASYPMGTSGNFPTSKPARA